MRNFGAKNMGDNIGKNRVYEATLQHGFVYNTVAPPGSKNCDVTRKQCILGLQSILEENQMEIHKASATPRMLPPSGQLPQDPGKKDHYGPQSCL